VAIEEINIKALNYRLLNKPELFVLYLADP